MARPIAKWEAEVDPPSLHDTREGAVAAELAALLGEKGQANGGNTSLAFGIAREMVGQHQRAIQILSQLASPETGKPS